MTDLAADSAIKTVTFTVDGTTLQVPAGEMVIAAAERGGVYIPRFCYHPRMRPVGMCRMCLVEIAGPRGFSLQPACFQEVREGMEIRTTTDPVRKAQDGVLEFLLVNHPLDCPVCDKGGECPLQDQTLTFGPGESRFLEEKRHWAKPIPISPLVDLDRERCIQCDRCTRFAKEVAGDPLIQFVGRGDHIEVNTFPDHPFASYFSGNTVQICPVGALTATPYRFRARPWDLEQVESTCTTCAVGCRVAVQSSGNRLVRLLGVDVDGVNQSWLCDRGRFGFEATNAPSRRTVPMARAAAGTEPGPIGWTRALALVAERLSAARSRSGAESVAVLGGGRLANEDAYAWAKLAKAVLGTDSVDCQLSDGLPAEIVLGLPRATIDEACTAKAVLVMAGDLKEDLPILWLRLRGAVNAATTKLVELSPVASTTTSLAAASLRYLPGELPSLVGRLCGTARGGAGADPTEAIARELLGIDGAAADQPAGTGVVVVLGRPSLAESEITTAAAALALAEALPGARFLPALRRGNVQGALDAGLAPGLLPGRVRLEDGAATYGSVWGSVPSARGRDATAILTAAAAGELSVLVLLGSDPISDFPDRRLAAEALERCPFVVSVETVPNASSEHADVVLPAAAWAERSGTTTNIEGRLSTLGQKLVAPSGAWPDWMIATELAAALGDDLGFSSLDDVWDELERCSPLHSGLTRSALSGPAARDGIVLPLPQTRVTVGRRRIAGLDPMAVPGISSVETQGSPSFAGSVRRSPEEPSANGHSSHATAKPPQLLWQVPPDDVTAPAVDRYSLRLVVRRPLYDQGALVLSCPSLAPLAPSAVLAVHPSELQRLGVEAGDQVGVTSARGRMVLPTRADAGVPAGVALLAGNVSDGVAAGLVDATAPVTEIRLETLQ